MNCYCGNPKNYADCCETAHLTIASVATAEQLMRSRYSAFVLADGDYLMQSHHPTTRPLKEKKSIVKWAKSVNWMRLEVLDTSNGKGTDTKGTVTFNAYYYENGKVEVIHEKSAFLKENGIWLYLGLAK